MNAYSMDYHQIKLELYSKVIVYFFGLPHLRD